MKVEYSHKLPSLGQRLLLFALIYIVLLLWTFDSKPVYTYQDATTSSAPLTANTDAGKLASTSLPFCPGVGFDHTAVDTTTSSSQAPLMMIENVGQFDENIRYQLWGGSWFLSIMDDQLLYTQLPTQQTAVDGVATPVHIELTFLASNPEVQIEPFGRLETSLSTFVGNNPDNWYVDIPTWQGVRLRELYPGLDLEISGHGRLWTPRLLVHDPAALNEVKLQINQNQSINLQNGRLTAESKLGPISLPLLQVPSTAVPEEQLPAPQLLKNIIETPFTTEWVQEESYKLQATSFTDVLYATYLGILSYDGGRLAIGPTGKAYVAGMTHPYFGDEQSGFCNVGNNLPCNQGFVARLSTNGQNLEQLLIFGGSNNDYVEDIVVNSTGEVFVTGATESTNFPTTAGAVSTTHGSGTLDGFVSKISAAGTLLYSTYLPGATEEASYGLAVDQAGMAYAAGWFTNGAQRDAVVVKLNSTGMATIYGAALGGSGRDEANDIAVNQNGEVFVTGYTESTNFPVTSGVVASSKGSGGYDGFVVRLQANASYSYATYLPGNTAEIGRGITIDGSNNAYITGVYDFSGQNNAMAIKLNPSGTTTLYGSGFGGSAADEGYEIAVDSFGQAYITGFTSSNNFPVTTNAIQNSKPPNNGEVRDSFVTKFDFGGQLIYGSYFGGSELDYGTGISVGSNAAVYMTGFTNSASIAEGGGFPVTSNSYRSVYVPGCQDPFVAQLAIGPEQLYIPLITE